MRLCQNTGTASFYSIVIESMKNLLVIVLSLMTSLGVFAQEKKVVAVCVNLCSRIDAPDCVGRLDRYLVSAIMAEMNKMSNLYAFDFSDLFRDEIKKGNQNYCRSVNFFDQI